MSSSGDDPRTPDRRTSSSTLFNAFRNLTRGSFRSPTPPPALSSTTAFPARKSVPGALLPSDAVQSAPAGPTAGVPAQGGLKPGQGPQGGPKELDHLVAQLHSSRPLQLRIAAVEQIVKILKEYPVRQVLALWAQASDLVLTEQAGETRAAGYKLLRGCAALPDLSVVERNVFFAAACLRQGTKYLDSRLDIISTLTNGGRNIDGCEALIVAFVLESLEDCSKDSFGVPRKAQDGKKIAQDSAGDGDNMSMLFQYIIDVCRFNSKLLNDSDLYQLLNKTMDICERTYTHEDIANAIRLFDTIIVYVHIPLSALNRCLDVLCSIYYKLADLREITWNALCNLFRSHFGQAAVAALLRTVASGSNVKIRDSTHFRGAIRVLQILLLEDPRNDLPKVPLSLLIPALRSTIKERHENHEKAVIGLLRALLEDERIRHTLLDEANWIDLIEIIRTCAGHEGTTERAVESAVSAVSAGGIGASVTPTGEVDNDTKPNSEMTTAPPRSDSITRDPDDDLYNVLRNLLGLSRKMESIQRAEIMQLLMQLSRRLDDSMAEDVVRFYIEERLFYPSNESWLEACRTLVSGILTDRSRPRSLRILCIHTLRDTHGVVESICPSDTVLQCAALLLDNIEAEEDGEVLKELVDFAVEVIEHASDASFGGPVEVLRRRLEHHKYRMQNSNTGPNPVMVSSPFNPRPVEHPLGSPCNVIATAFVRLFIRCVVKSARKTHVLYEDLRHIVGCDYYDSDARLTALKLLFRLRAESDHALLVSSSSEGESIAAVLCRTAETALAAEKSEDAIQSDGTKFEEVSWREQRKVSGSSPHSSLNRNIGRQANVSGRVAKPVPPLWMYPGPKGLPEEPSSRASRVVFSHVDPEEYPLPDDILDLEVTLWLELVISLLQKAPDWEIYSYVLVHLGPQLSNQALVRSCVAQLRMLRNVVCEQIRNSSFHEPPSYTLLKKADVAVCLFHILTVLLSYHDYFEKSEEDDVVKTFLHGIGSWDRTSVWCIHALTVCCHEIPLSVSKSLDNIIQKMSQIITKPSTAIHILEFLTFVARMPELYKNFREEEFKMVFGVSFRYIQHVRDQRDRASSTSTSQGTQRALRHSGPSRDFTSSPDRHTQSRSKAAADDLPQYVYSLAYHVITFWFISLKMEDRPKQIPWITQRLLYTDASGKQVMEEQGHVIVDMMHNLAYNDSGETVRDDNFAKPSDGEIWSKTWILGHSLITIETASRTGVSMITSRRPCGTRYMYTRPVLAPLPRHQVPLVLQLESKDFHSTSDVAILPDDIFQTFFAPLNLTDPPIPLPDDPMTKRSIETFDRNATVDGHKVGVIYIGEGQMGQACERAIFLNNIGSAAYTSFLDDLGTLVRLKGAQFNTGGLDRSNDMDGEFTYCWRDRVIELVFHITTMMPKASDIDMTYANKKRHVGNDYVNIIFNDSGLPYDYETFPSQFNYVAIVITPESRASFVDRRLDSDPEGKSRYYKVQVMSKPGFPDISPAVEPKILCGKHLAAYCRLLAINASVFSQVWARRDGGESISSWRNRLREIKRLRERYGAGDLSLVSGPFSPTYDLGVSSPPPRENTASAQSFKRTSVATFISEGTNRSSITSPSHDASN
ncbi:uncharacterized protein EI97DRAFT_132093 [Westerdykella ornata]|uniref:Rap-GAP domain-containing protein n=1 Tax=Westerdykella ornata TaxID=318751 RepID=A0A6A6JCU6_WESOR|nr:uncharacterized protein EI97DRAFT_132093 [Westerdykella ornata]KAF2274252.1 hypothetical protein EI97DRAFT_132093 [Westerdykella ornata]